MLYKWIIQHLSFGNWLLSLSIMFSRFIHILVSVLHYFLLLSNSVWTDHTGLFIRQVMDIWVVSTSWWLWIMLLYVCTHFYGAYIFISCGHVPRSGIAGSYGNSVFNLLRSCQTVVHRGCSILHSHLPRVKFWFLHTFTNICYHLPFWMQLS